VAFVGLASGGTAIAVFFIGYSKLSHEIMLDDIWELYCIVKEEMV
jgi:hypothetical protein